MDTKFRGFMTIDMSVDTWNHGFQIIHNVTWVNKYFDGIFKVVDCPIHEKYEITCPANKNDFTESEICRAKFKIG